MNGHYYAVGYVKCHVSTNHIPVVSSDDVGGVKVGQAGAVAFK